jgi:biopolymer transport protein ExbB
MSVASWVVMLRQFWWLARARADVPRCVAAFWQAAGLEQAEQELTVFDRQNVLRPLLTALACPKGPLLGESMGVLAQLNRQLREALQGISARLNWGQTVLASVGSIAPFVGLLGTVWGIFHALTGLANVSSLSLDQVAGPVGESLVMTAAGLAVAIPAVLAFNLLGRWAGQVEGALEGFAHDLRELGQQAQS